ncbi:MARVEL domain-containing protein [Trichonephila clavata]|uniref:MARVEL domain-containing protein n=1 Tax=Trichonephila clavata TaxID=2740835 RepID=A0A8X6GFP5_TRICU|nr:MARVEL domain-containing protein [Trichonephila clavata]
MPEGLPERAQVAVERAREFLAWTLKDVFDWNPQYLKELRGILNIIEVVVSLLIVSMIGNVCQSQATLVNEEIGGFYCRNTDTFLFSIGMASLLGSTLHLLCCALSKKTEDRLWGTSYEFVFYIFYSFFYFFAGIAATSNVINRNSGQMQVEEGYNNFIGGGVSVFLTDRARL